MDRLDLKAPHLGACLLAAAGPLHFLQEDAAPEAEEIGARGQQQDRGGDSGRWGRRVVMMIGVQEQAEKGRVVVFVIVVVMVGGSGCCWCCWCGCCLLRRHLLIGAAYAKRARRRPVVSDGSVSDQ